MVIAASLVRRTEMAVLFLAALAILLIAPGAVSAQGTESEGATEEPVWSADMLVVEYTSISIGAASADLFSNIGGSADLQIKSLWSYIPDRDLRLSFEDGVPDAADYTLQVGDLTLEFPEESSGNSGFKWTDVDVDWEDGQTISVRIVQTSALEEPAANTPATGEPTISGTSQVDQTLMANTATIADEDGLDDVSYSYQWIRSDNGADTDISGETDSTYTLVYADQGKTVKVKVSFTDDADNDETLTSEATEVVTAAPNRGATGDPTINGTPKVDQTLTADTSDIADEDGLDGVSYNYQWLADDGNIDGATGSTYVPANGDAGKAIKVSVSFTDDRNYAEARTSAPTATIAAIVPTQPLSLTVAAGDEIQELDASWQAPSSNGGSTVTGYKLQWKEVADNWDTEADVSESTVTGTTHTITGLTGEVAYAVRVIATNTAGDGPASAEVKGTPAGGVSQQTSEPENNDPNQGTVWSGILTVGSYTPSAQFFGRPTMIWLGYSYGSFGSFSDTPSFVSGGVTYRVYNLRATNAGDEVRLVIIPTPQQDFVLTIDDFQLSSGDAHGTDYVVFRYFKWADPGLNWSENQQVAVSLTLVETESSLNIADGEATEGDDATLDFVVTLDPAASTEVTVDYTTLDGTATAGSDYTATSGTLTFATGDTSKTVSVPIVDGTVEDGHETFKLLLSNANGAETADAEATGTILNTEANTPAAGLPTVTGMPQVGETLTAHISTIADEDGLDDVSYNYQWIRNDGSADTDIEDATDSTYTLTDTDVGKIIKVKVSFTDDGDNQESLISEATVAVAATVPSAPQSLTVARGSQIQELDVSWQAPSSNGGSNVTGYKVQWKESAGSWDTETDVSEATVTGTTHTITNLTGGVEYAVRVIATNVAGDGPASTEARATPADGPASGEEGTETVESDSSAAWTATLTVGVSGSGNETVWGYSWFLDGMGTLDERTYNEGDQTIEVMAILLSNGFVAFNVRPHPSVDFVLTVDGTEFASADASEVKSQTLISYVWATTLDWAEDDRVALSLTLKDTDEVAAKPNTPATGAPTIDGTAQVGETLTALTNGITDADGLTNATYRYQWTAGGSDISGATGSSHTLTSSEEGLTVQVRVTFTDDAGNQESLTSVATETVAAKPIPLTATFSNMPSSHSGTWFEFTLTFSENVKAGYERIRDDAFTVSGGDVTQASRTEQGSNQGWTIRVQPTGNATVTITLPATTGCDATGAICTYDGRKLSHSTSVSLVGPE